VQHLLGKIAAQDESVKDFSEQADLIRCGNRIWVGSDAEVQQLILQSDHDSVVGGIPESELLTNVSTIISSGRA
jgi:hypothetical protein